MTGTGTTLHALLVGIDAYPLGVPLCGCRNDVEMVRAYLDTRRAAGSRLAVRTLVDRAATRSAVIAGFRDHLGRANAGDSALFWFSGHGSRARVGSDRWPEEPSGWRQTLVCVDSRVGGVPDLFDTELSALVDGLAARGVHVAVVLDCCHAEGADRGGTARVRGLPPAVFPGGPADLWPATRDAAGPPLNPGERIALAACRGDGRAHELRLDGTPRGLFSWALLRALGALGATATYRQLLTAARCDVEAWYPTQVPQLDRLAGGVADRPFLGGDALTPATGIVLRHVRGWEIDAGSCHGLPPAPDPSTAEESAVDGALRVAVHAPGGPVREAVVTRVHSTRSDVRPDGWEPDIHVQYPVVVSDVPVPPAVVAIGDGGYPGLAARVRTALGHAGPGGRPSPHVRPAAPGEPAQLRVLFPDPALIRIVAGDGDQDRPLCPDTVDIHGEGPARAVRALEHIARWRALRALANPGSALATAVHVEVVPDRATDVTVPIERPALVPGEDGAVTLDYRRTPSGWSPPTAFIRLRNEAGRPLYGVLLDLTDRYRCHAWLFPGAQIGPGVVTGARRGRDWLKLLVAEEPFAVEPFELPALGEPAPPAAPPSRGLPGIVGRLGWRANHRDAGAGPEPVADWATSVLPVLIRVPG